MPYTTSSSNYYNMASDWREVGRYTEEVNGQLYLVRIMRQDTSGGYAVKEVRTLQLSLFDATHA